MIVVVRRHAVLQRRLCDEDGSVCVAHHEVEAFVG